MEKKRFSIPQEGLKLMAALTMLLDHVGLLMQPESAILRAVGRIAMPLYCFLLAEGFQHTRSRGRYLLRLFLLATLSEYPFDLMLYGHPSWLGQNVIFTLVLAFLAMLALEKAARLPLLPRCLCALLAGAAGFYAAEYLGTDYGGFGVLFVLLFYCTRDLPKSWLWQAAGFLILAWYSGSYTIALGPFQIPIETLGVLAMVPISLYRGKKRSRSPLLRWSFSLFYPVHMLLLVLIFS